MGSETSEAAVTRIKYDRDFLLSISRKCGLFPPPGFLDLLPNIKRGEGLLPPPPPQTRSSVCNLAPQQVGSRSSRIPSLHELMTEGSFALPCASGRWDLSDVQRERERSTGSEGRQQKTVDERDRISVSEDTNSTGTVDGSGSPTKSVEGKKGDASSMKKQIEALKKNLECPACLKLPKAPLYLCTHGHTVCGSCRLKHLKCPTCHHVMLNTRNLLAEQLLGILELKCRFAGQGCRDTFLDAEIGTHELSCHYRPISCNFGGGNKLCKDAQVNYKRFLAHLLMVHKMNGVVGTCLDVFRAIEPQPELNTDIPWSNWPVQFMSAFDETFLTGTCIKNERIFWWLYLFGEENVAKDYRCSITLTNKINDIEMTWRGPVHHIRTDPEMIEMSGLCLMMSKENLQPFCLNHGEMDNGEVVLKAFVNLIFKVEKKNRNNRF